MIQANTITSAIRSNSSSTTGEGRAEHVTIAKGMPTPIGIGKVVDPANHSFDLGGEFHRKPLQRIYSPSSAPSAISSENFLAARALLSQGFVHNIALTKQARISNLYKEAPEFREQINILV